MCLKKKEQAFISIWSWNIGSSKLESSVNMPNYCVTVGCKNTAKKGSEYSFHRFPHQNPNLLKKWVHAIRRKQWKPTKHSFICSDHFHESCFVIRPGAEGRRLKDDAVPWIFQTFPSYYQKDIKLQRSPRKRQYVAHERKKFTISKILLTVWSSKNWLVMLNSICLNRTLMELANICLKIK